MVQRIAKGRTDVDHMLPGRKGPQKSKDAQMAQHVSYVRRKFSFLAVQQQARLLLDRLSLLGDRASEAAKRRDWAARAERAATRERRAQDVA